MNYVGNKWLNLPEKSVSHRTLATQKKNKYVFSRMESSRKEL